MLLVNTLDQVFKEIQHSAAVIPTMYSLQVMTAFALQRRLQNVGVTVSSLHPGAVSWN